MEHQRFERVFEERLRSLLEDHYCKRVDSRTDRLWFVRLKHMANGNSIILRGDPTKGTISQWTNGLLKFCGVY